MRLEKLIKLGDIVKINTTDIGFSQEPHGGDIFCMIKVRIILTFVG
jgi:hypothetical protein